MTKQELERESQKARTEATAATRKLWEPQMPKRSVTLLNAMGYLMFGCGLGLIIYVSYLLLYPFMPLTLNGPVTIETPVVKAGSALVYQISACKHTPDTPTIYKKIVSAQYSEPYPAVQGVVVPGCTTTKVPLAIQTGTPPGKYMLYTEVVYHVNALRDIHVFWQAGPFQVVN